MNPSGPVTLPAISRVVHDYLTAEDGTTFAIGRGMALGMFTAMFGLTFGVSIWAAVTLKPSLTDWAAFLMAIGGFWSATSAGCWALIRGTSGTEPKAADAPSPPSSEFS